MSDRAKIHDEESIYDDHYFANIDKYFGCDTATNNILPKDKSDEWYPENYWYNEDDCQYEQQDDTFDPDTYWYNEGLI